MKNLVLILNLFLWSPQAFSWPSNNDYFREGCNAGREDGESGAAMDLKYGGTWYDGYMACFKEARQKRNAQISRLKEIGCEIGYNDGLNGIPQNPGNNHYYSEEYERCYLQGQAERDSSVTEDYKEGYDDGYEDGFEDGSGGNVSS